MKYNKLTFAAVALAATLSFSACKTQYAKAYDEAHGKENYASTKDADAANKGNNTANIQQNNDEVEPEQVRTEKYTLVSGNGLKHYNVVVGSFGKQENAIRLSQSLEGSLIVRNESGMYRVIFSTHDTYRDARTQLLEARETYPDAWVLVQKQ